MEPIVIRRHLQLLLAGFSFFGDPFHSHAGWTETNEIGRLWQRLYAFWQASESQTPPAVVYEVHVQTNETATTGEFEVFTGYEANSVEGLPYELCLKVLPETEYAIFRLKGAQILQDEPIIDDWLRANPYRIAHPFFIQRYDQRFKGLDRLEESELDFLVPVRRDE